MKNCKILFVVGCSIVIIGPVSVLCGFLYVPVLSFVLLGGILVYYFAKIKKMFNGIMKIHKNIFPGKYK
jgi:hypothetical protein